MSQNVSLPKNAKLTPKQAKAVHELLKGGTVANASQLANITERQIYRWMEQPEFKCALDRARDEAIAGAVRALSDAANGAVLVLRTIMNKEKPLREDSVRVRAATAVLANSLHWVEMEVIERRLSELEKQNVKYK